MLVRQDFAPKANVVMSALDGYSICNYRTQRSCSSADHQHEKPFNVLGVKAIT